MLWCTSYRSNGFTSTTISTCLLSKVIWLWWEATDRMKNLWPLPLLILVQHNDVYLINDVTEIHNLNPRWIIAIANIAIKHRRAKAGTYYNDLLIKLCITMQTWNYCNSAEQEDGEMLQSLLLLQGTVAA